MTNQATEHARMGVAEILKNLELYTGRFPKRAMQEAVGQREAITPELLRALENVAADPGAFAERKDYMLHVFAAYLLAQFRERRAYEPLVRIVSASGDIPDALFGDTVTEGLKQLLGSAYDGNREPLQRLVEGPNVNEYVRGAALDAFLVLVSSDQMSREDVIAYYRSLFRGGLERVHSHAWNGLVSAVADLHAPELLEDVRQAYADNLVDLLFARFDDIERDLAAPPRPLRRCHVIADAIAEMEWWHCFQPKDSVARRPLRPATPSAATVPARSAKVGRNEPCPCGSGKKYKKCCGNN